MKEFMSRDFLLTTKTAEKLYYDYAEKMPIYDVAFVFMQENYNDLDVPPWAIKIILSPDEIGEEVKETKW